MQTPRGIRNNNPGNIRLGAPWQGLAPEQTDPAFCQFTSPAYGIRAIAKIFRTYADSYGLNTVQALIDRWAPPNENNTGAYVSAVAQQCGVDPGAPVDVHDDAFMGQLVAAVIQHENGEQPYSAEQIQQGVSLAT